MSRITLTNRIDLDQLESAIIAVLPDFTLENGFVGLLLDQSPTNHILTVLWSTNRQTTYERELTNGQLRKIQQVITGNFQAQTQIVEGV
jgi:hypothetical protein